MMKSREVYMEHRKDAEEFAGSERGKYAIAQALSFFIDNHESRVGTHSTGTVDDIQYLLSRIFMPYLWGGDKWFGDK